ncbi:MAG: hypothetical protein V4581_04585, partial [Bacteroidota bacterium]
MINSKIKNLLSITCHSLALLLVVPNLRAQQQEAPQQNNFFKDRKLYLNDDGSNYVKFTFLAQAWLRSAQYNPGTTVYGYDKSSGADIGIRRYRVQMYGQLTDRVFAYSQFGENNFNALSERKQGFFVHDAYGEYAIDKARLSMGMGLSGWSGLARFAAPSAGSIMGLDAPLYQQATNDVTDQFLRKLSVFAKGKLGKLDYRVQMAQPLAIQRTSGYNSTVTTNAGFSAKPAKMQYNGYMQYQFNDQESNLTPYMTGSYLGEKKVFNIGAGFMYQKDAMWRQGASATDTIYSNMANIAVDVYYDAPLGNAGRAISLYASVAQYDFGKNYLRNA